MTPCTCDATGNSGDITWCQWHSNWLHFIPYVKTIDMRCNLVMLWHWHWCQGHMMLMASSMAQFHSLCQNDWNGVQHNFLIMGCHWHCHRQHVMLIALSIALFHLLGQDDWNEVKHDFSNYVLPLAQILTSHNAFSIINGTITSHTSEQSKLGETFFGHVTQLPLPLASHDAICIGVTWCHWHQHQCHMMPITS